MDFSVQVVKLDDHNVILINYMGEKVTCLQIQVVVPLPSFRLAKPQLKKKKKNENDVHLKQDEQHFRLHSSSTCLLSNPVCIHHTEEASCNLSNEAVPRHCVLMSAPPAWMLTLSVFKSYRSWECLLVEHCSSSLNRLPWIPGAWPHYNFHT